jgi:hypothetical protein
MSRKAQEGHSEEEKAARPTKDTKSGKPRKREKKIKTKANRVRKA